MLRVTGRSEDRANAPTPECRNNERERLKEDMRKEAGRDGKAAVFQLDITAIPSLAMTPESRFRPHDINCARTVPTIKSAMNASRPYRSG